jgi:hypothetical protein
MYNMAIVAIIAGMIDNGLSQLIRATIPST